MSQTLIHASVLLADIIGITVIVLGLFREHQQLYPSWHKIGLIVMALGMLGQAVQSVQFFAFGVINSVFILPMWAFKDYAVAIICTGYMWLAHQQMKEARAVATTHVAQTIAEAAKKRGRPVGSTNKPKPGTRTGVRPAVLAKTANRAKKK